MSVEEQLKTTEFLTNLYEKSPKYKREDFLGVTRTHKDFVFFWQQKDGVMDKGVFSQWYMSPFTIDGIEYNCCEQYMMAQKAVLFNDEKVLEEIMKEKRQKRIKALGRKVKNFDEEVWNQNAQKIVFIANMAKFTQSKELNEMIMNTRNRIIVEASPLDGIWGIKMAEDNEDAADVSKWGGTNYLGFALMNVRETIKNLQMN